MRQLFEDQAVSTMRAVHKGRAKALREAIASLSEVERELCLSHGNLPPYPAPVSVLQEARRELAWRAALISKLK